MVLTINRLLFVGEDTMGVGKIKKGCHAEALEACGQRPLRECFECLSMTPRSFYKKFIRKEANFIFRTAMARIPTKAKIIILLVILPPVEITIC